MLKKVKESVHHIIYYGRYSISYEPLKEQGKEGFMIAPEDGEPYPPIDPSDRADGIIFGYMEKLADNADERFWAVLVDDIVLEEPIVLVPERHTDGKGFGPNGCLFGDESAKNLVADCIRQNRAQWQLVSVYNRCFDEFWRG
ncbi:MAG TPA: hypothetical protein VLL52_10580 [Anaerolineae bacterium]|nr:hypothetical protein [Anaerolineae bacterium]